MTSVCLYGAYSPTSLNNWIRLVKVIICIKKEKMCLNQYTQQCPLDRRYQQQEMAPKSYSQNMTYNRRIGRLLFILIGVMLLVALLAGFIGAYVRLGGIKHRATPQPRISRRLAKATTIGGSVNLAELEEHIEKPDLFVALRLAKEHLDKQKSSEPSTSGQTRDDKSGAVPLEFQDLCFILAIDRVIDEPAMKYLRSFVGVNTFV